jgi:hypothetical protein
MARRPFYMYIYRCIRRKIIFFYYNRTKLKNFGQNYVMVYTLNCIVINFDWVKLYVQVTSNVVFILFFSLSLLDVF